MSSFQWEDIDLGAGNIVDGIISNIDYEKMTATVIRGGHVIDHDIPIHYHCEEDNTDNGSTFSSSYPDSLDEAGADAFHEGDTVNVMFRGAKNTRPLIIGFPDSAPACETVFYLRVTIDGNRLTHGGQNFYIRYKDLSGIWQETTPSYVRGNALGTESEKYFYAGPFDLSDWGGGDVEVHLYPDRIKAGRDPQDDVIDNVEQGKMFEYYMEDNNGGKLLVTKIAHTERDDASLWNGYVSDPEHCYRTDPDHVIVRYFEVYGSFFEGTLENPGTWESVLDHYVWKQVYGAKKYSKVTTIYKTFSESQFRGFFQNRETKIYNWSTGAWESNKIVVVTDLSFGLKMFDRLRYQITTFLQGAVTYPYYTYPTPAIDRSYQTSDIFPRFLLQDCAPTTASQDWKIPAGEEGWGSVLGGYDYIDIGNNLLAGSPDPVRAQICTVDPDDPDLCDFPWGRPISHLVFDAYEWDAIEGFFSGGIEEYIHIIGDRGNPTIINSPGYSAILTASWDTVCVEIRTQNPNPPYQYCWVDGGWHADKEFSSVSFDNRNLTHSGASKALDASCY